MAALENKRLLRSAGLIEKGAQATQNFTLLSKNSEKFKIFPRIAI